MNASTITVSNGQEFYRIPVTDLDEAKQDGFYVPAEMQRTIVSDGTELFEVPLTDVAEAQRDGFHDILVGERAASSDLEATAEPVTGHVDVIPLTTRSPAEPPPMSVKIEVETETAGGETRSEAKSPSPVKVEVATEAEEGEEDEEVLTADRRQLLGVFGFSSLVHAAVVLILLSIIIPIEMEDRVEILSALPAVDQENVKFEEVALIQPEQIEQDETSEVVQELITDSDKVLEIDINDLEISSAIPEKTKGAGNPVAKITGELGGRSRAGRSALVARYGGNAASESAVRAGLEWLSRHQNADDGSWSFDHVHAGCQGSCSQAGSLKRSHMGATAMALLSMLGSGETHFVGTYREQVYKGFDYLLTYAKQTPDGLDLRGAAEGNTGMYIQGLATMALCEAVVMSEMALKQRSRSSRAKTKKNERVDRKVATASLKRLRAASQLALNFIMRAQDPANGGWRYQPRKGGDTSVLGWQVMALKSGQMAKMQILPDTIRKASYYLDSVQIDGGAAYGYTGPQRKVSTTAVGLLSRMYIGWGRKEPALESGVKFLAATGPSRNDMYYNYYATQVLHHWGGEEWENWNKVMREQLVKSQRRKGHAAGSWDVADSHGRSGGRLYMTSLCVMTLEVYYRHLPLYQQAGQLKSSASKKSRKRSGSRNSKKAAGKKAAGAR
ncbi:MAG TPA: hypothetical protein DCE47_23415 [Planctomycetaceae bacterium]|nr:hypothetical protein [Planctomycetaceae bacterium]